MKLTVKEDPAMDDIEVSIACPCIDHRVRRIIEATEAEGGKIAGLSDGFFCVVDIADVLYAESVDGSTFLYTKEKVIESGMSLTEIEDDLEGFEIIRASRQMLVNLAHVSGLRPYLNARLELVLDNGEHVIVSRQFAPTIKKRIGI